jgi:hypothetical protein
MTAYMSFPFYETLQTRDRWLLIFLYSYQIYANFFGYFAIGLGLLFGYRLPVNFDLPYISTSFSEFWTRWHRDAGDGARLGICARRAVTGEVSRLCPCRPRTARSKSRGTAPVHP